MIRETFSEWLCSKIDENGKITQASLSRELNVNRSTINHWCKGTRLPSPIYKERIAISSLFGFKPNPYDKEDDKEKNSVNCMMVSEEVFEHNLSLIRTLCHNQSMHKWLSNTRI